MKVLSVGNSFSQDAQRWLHELSLASDEPIDTYNLYIGGCTLKTHMDCIKARKAEYSFEGNGNDKIRMATANEIIENEKYDVITVQQASGFSGKPQSYLPYLTELADYIRKHQPKAKLYFHKTWSYEIDSTHGHFAFYNNNQEEMDRRIDDCAQMAAKLIDADILPVGDFISYLRHNTPSFDVNRGGLSLCRDGFHLSLNYGRFAASAVWFQTLTGKLPNAERFLAGKTEFNADIIETVMQALRDMQNA